MKLLVFVCVCALAAAAERPSAAPTTAQLAAGLTHMYRRFLHVAAPKQLEIQDALDITWRNGMMSGPRFVSPVKGTFGGVEAGTFSYINSLITPGQKGFFGQWTKHETSDLVSTYHYGGLTKIHMLTDNGIHKEVILGNPLHNEKAKFVVMIPKNTYCIFESLSEDDASFISYIAIPVWDPTKMHNHSQEEMEAKFPAFAEMFKNLTKPGVHHHHDDDDHDEHDHEHDAHGHGGKRPNRRRFGGRRFSRH